jgi:hypothetical protein
LRTPATLPFFDGRTIRPTTSHLITHQTTPHDPLSLTPQVSPQKSQIQTLTTPSILRFTCKFTFSSVGRPILARPTCSAPLFGGMSVHVFRYSWMELCPWFAGVGFGACWRLICKSSVIGGWLLLTFCLLVVIGLRGREIMLDCCLEWRYRMSELVVLWIFVDVASTLGTVVYLPCEWHHWKLTLAYTTWSPYSHPYLVSFYIAFCFL